MTQNPRPKLELIRSIDDAPNLPLSDGRHDELEPRPEQQVDEVVYEAQILSDEPAKTTLPAAIVDRVMVVRSPDGRKKVARTTAQHGAFVLAGGHSWTVRMVGGLTDGVIREQIRAAKALGDHEKLAFWIDKRREAKKERRDRLMELPLLAVNVAKFLGISLIGALVLLLALSTVVWATGVGEFGAVWELMGGLIRLILNVFKYGWPVIPPAVLVMAWREGRRQAASASWSTAPGAVGRGDARGILPNEGAIFTALGNIGLGPLNAAIKAGWKPRFIGLGTVRDGDGWRTQLQLPQGVTVEMIIAKKKVLAHNLVRFPVEVWPTEPRDQPGVLDLWVADQGSLTGKVKDWPLLASGGADYFGGVPVAVDIRGKVIKALLSEKNYSFAGMMGSGKSTMIITTLCGAMLDPLVEIEVFVLAENADYKPMKRRLRTLVTGPGTEVVMACLAAMRDLYADLVVRGKALQEYGDDVRAVTRELAEKDERLRPRVFVVDECQALFMHPELGEEAEDLAVQLMGAARKYGVTMMFATPEPSTDSLPRKLMAVISNKACFAIGDHTSNDAALGTGSYKAGISAVGLEPKTDEGPGDIGTCMARGFQPKPGLLRSFYVNGTQVAAVTERALKIRQDAGIGPARAVVEAPRDLLDDLDEVLGSERIRLSDIPGLLRKLAPIWLPYQSLTGLQVRDVLVNQHGVRVTNTGNVLRLDPADLREVRTLRDASE